MTVHPIDPVYDGNSKILILGSFPSVRSRATGFFYGHPSNRFWTLLAALLGEDTPVTVNQKKELLLKNGVALWDVIAECEIKGSADAQIRNASPNDLFKIINAAPVKAVFTNGKTSHSLYMKFFADKISLPEFCLPSTSPANAAFGMDRLQKEWSVITDFLR